MRIEPLPVDLELLDIMHEGRNVPASVMARYLRVRRRWVLVGGVGPLPKETLAMLSDDFAQLDELPIRQEEPTGRPSTLEESQVLTDPSQVEFESVSSSKGDGKVKNLAPQFKSKPGDKWTKVEKDRPLSYVSEKDFARHAGWFVKVDPKDKARIIIRSSESRKNFGIPNVNAELSDLTISTEPRAVQV